MVFRALSRSQRSRGFCYLVLVYTLLIELVCAQPLVGSTSPEREIVFSYWNEATPPFAFVEGDQLTGGILKDLGDAIGAELGKQVTYQKLPVARIEPSMREGAVDIDCITSPVWKETPDDYLWSLPLFDGADRLLVRRDNQTNIRVFEDLKGRNLGIYNGYIYHPQIMKMIDEGDIKAVKVADVEKGLSLLKLKRIDALIDFGVLLRYQLKTNDSDGELALADLRADDYTLSCAYSRKSKIDPSAIDDALRELIDTGKMEHILSKYR